jgi:hypothetical protein
VDTAAAEDTAEGGVIGGEGGVYAVGSPQEKGAQHGVPTRQEQADKTEGDSVEEQGYDRHRQHEPEGRISQHLFETGMEGADGGAVQRLRGGGGETAGGLLPGKPRGGVCGQMGQKLLEACGGGVNLAAYLSVAA